jgi:hypothetical protein
LDLGNLEEAYRKAGKAFRGQLSQNFVVMTEDKSKGGQETQEGHNIFLTRKCFALYLWKIILIPLSKRRLATKKYCLINFFY